MKINKLTAVNVKGLTFQHELAPVTVVTGRNFSGKTAVLTALRLALLGHDPKLGKTNSGIFAACGCKGGGATKLGVAAKLSDGTEICRVWESKKGKVSYTGPDDEKIPAMMLDPTTYFKLTGPARLNYVLSQCDVGALGLNYEGVLDTVNTNVKVGTDAARKALAEALETINTLEQARSDEDANVYEWLTSVVDEITNRRNTAKMAVDTHEETVKGLVDNKVVDGNMTVIQSVQPELDEAREQYTAAAVKASETKAAVTAAERALNDARTLAAKRVDHAKVEQLIQHHASEVGLLSIVPAAGNEPGSRTLPTQRPSEAVERTALNSARSRMEETRRVLDACKAAVKQMEDAIASNAKKTTCPTCGHDITGQQKEVLATLKDALENAGDGLLKAEANHKVNCNLVTNAEQALELALKNAANWDAAAEQLRLENQTELQKWNSKVSNYNSAQAKINEHKSHINQLRASIENDAKANEAWVELPRLQEAVEAAHAAHAAAVNAVTPIEQRIKDLEVKQRQFVARMEQARLADQSRKLLTEATERLDVFKNVLKVVAVEKERVSEAAFNGLLSEARLFTDGILMSPLEYRDGELGMARNGNWVPYTMFSGTEELLAFAGLGVALTQQHKGVRVVLMDELGRVDKSNKIKLVKRLRRLINDDIIDNAILCDVDGEDYDGCKGDIGLIAIDSASITA